MNNHPPKRKHWAVIVCSAFQCMKENSWRKSYPGYTNLPYNLMIKFQVHLFLINFLYKLKLRKTILLAVKSVLYGSGLCDVLMVHNKHTLWALIMFKHISRNMYIWIFVTNFNNRNVKTNPPLAIAWTSIV